MSNCHCHTEIARDGSGQLTRYLAALDPAYAKVDGRSIQDLLVFAQKYAEQLRFYDIPGNELKDDIPGTKISWVEFFRRDMGVLAAAVTTATPDAFRMQYDSLRAALDQAPDTNGFEALFKPIIQIMVLMDGWYSVAIPGNPIQEDLQLSIQSVLAGQVQKMKAYAEGYRTVDVKRNITLDFTDIVNDGIWKVNDEVDPDNTIFQGDTPEDQIKYAALYIDDIFLAFYNALVQLSNNGDGYMQFALKEYPAHQPHMGLFLSFLQLFQLAQEQMNGITGRMLDFYYRDVLHLSEKPSVPDRTHVIFELAKDVTEYPLDQGTALSAGKDASGKEQTYITENALVINQAKVKELKTIFINKTPADGMEGVKSIQTIYARPVANSQDGLGAKFIDKYPHWPTFGQGPALDQTFTDRICRLLEHPVPETIRMDKATIGFAVASPQLLLQGGRRFLLVGFDGMAQLMKQAANLKDGSSPFSIYFTGEKEWLQVNMQADLNDVYKQLDSTGIFPQNTPQTAVYSMIQLPTGGTYLMINLPISAPPIIGFNPKLHTGYAFNTTLPVMRIMLNPQLGLSAHDYRNLQASSFSIQVTVGSMFKGTQSPTGLTAGATIATGPFLDGLRTLVIQNDLGVQATNKPFDPFTFLPSRGKSFYIGSDEVFNKSLDRLGVNIKRTVEIDDYGADNSVAYAVELLQDRQWTRLGDLYNGNSYGSFSSTNLSRDILYALNGTTAPKHLSYYREPVLPVSNWTPQSVKGFLKVSNLYNPSAGGGEFPPPPPSLQEQALTLEINQLSISYASQLNGLVSGIDQFFHVYPFGVAEISLDEESYNATTGMVSLQSNLVTGLNYLYGSKKNAAAINANDTLLPQFTFVDPFSRMLTVDNTSINTHNDGGYTINPASLGTRSDRMMAELLLHASGLDAGSRLNQYSGQYQEEGMLFIGLENLQPLQSLSLLFEFADGTAEDDEDDPPPINWSYLINNEWRPLPGEALVSDGTFGFQTTGIIRIDIPEDITTESTIITSGLSWLCASVTADSNRFPHLVDVIAQAAEVSFVDNNNDQRHFDEALPAGSITKLSVKVAEVSKVQQPFASFDGKHKEIGKEFYTRVSERLRHKARAITSWDYEHLVLDRYPTIYKVKCIPHTDPDCICWTAPSQTDANGKPLCCGQQVAPGHVLLVPLANMKNRTATNPLQPKTSRRTLLEIEAYLQQRTSPFVNVRARNPLYEQILVAFRVQFITGTDKGFYLKKLNDEIVRFLTPWAFDDSAAPVFGQKVYASAIINFIEERPYVDFITDFAMFVCRKDCCADTGPSVPQVTSDLLTDLMNASNCNDVEAATLRQPDYPGVVVAIPSTPRSILVSVPKHIIVPYKAPPQVDPCTQRKMNVTLAQPETMVNVANMDTPRAAIPDNATTLTAAHPIATNVTHMMAANNPTVVHMTSTAATTVNPTGAVTANPGEATTVNPTGAATTNPGGVYTTVNPTGAATTNPGGTTSTVNPAGTSNTANPAETANMTNAPDPTGNTSNPDPNAAANDASAGSTATKGKAKPKSDN
ncbi:MAG: hypothetical protein JO154_25400 [Chitinophaga sp.]|uniref:hypothetical protein n=1 Tax=Chitinophaga sp. TaxID=1869181 RepID=UPI0025B867AA|nr:hypothetical protein [Chitinophaga sp.]MBV8255956.1 hypothetical protein [Chitinophaga sp.]